MTRGDWVVSSPYRVPAECWAGGGNTRQLGVCIRVRRQGISTVTCGDSLCSEASDASFTGQAAAMSEERRATGQRLTSKETLENGVSTSCLSSGYTAIINYCQGPLGIQNFL